MTTRTSESGITLVEVIIGVSIIATLLVAIGFSVTAYVNARTALLNNVKSAYLAEEGYEIIRALRDDDWTTIDALALDTTLYLDVTPSTIAVTNTPEVIDTDFSRSFVLRAVYRDVNDDIVSASNPGATVDDGSREVEITVTGPSGTDTFEAVITNLYAI
jgi:type II secretory pathway pseudopilin PulG